MDNKLKNEIEEFPAILIEEEKVCDHFVISTFENQFLFMPLEHESIQTPLNNAKDSRQVNKI